VFRVGAGKLNAGGMLTSREEPQPRSATSARRKSHTERVAVVEPDSDQPLEEEHEGKEATILGPEPISRHGTETTSAALVSVAAWTRPQTNARAL